MPGTPTTVLFVHHGDQWIRGSERILIDHVAYLDPEKFRPVIWTNCQPLVEIAQSRGWPVAFDRFSVMLGHRRPTGDVGNFIHLLNRARALIREHGIGLVHCNAAESCQWMVPAGRLAGIPVVVHLHNDETSRSRIIQLVLHATAIVGGCESMIAPYRSGGVPSKFLRIIYNNVDPARLSQPPRVTRASLGIDDNAFVFMSVGSLVQRKGMDLVLQAFAGVRAVAPSTHLVIVGGGPLRDPLESLAAQLGVSANVTFYGESPSPAALVRDLADTSVMASSWEGFPLVLLEAGLFGTPVIATNVGGVPDLIRHEVTGLLVPPNDVDALRNAMRRVVEDHELRERIGANLERRIRTEMLAPTNTRQLEGLYAETLDAYRAGERPSLSWHPGYSRWLRGGIGAVIRRYFPFASR